MQSLCRQGVGGWPGGFPPTGRGLSNLQQGAVLGAGQCAEPAAGLTEGSAVSQGLFHGGAIAQADRGQSLAARSPCAQLPPQPTSHMLGARAGLTKVPHRSVGCSGAVLSWWLLPAPWPSCSRCLPSSTQCRVFQLLGTLPQGDVWGEEGSRLPAAWQSWGPRQREGTTPGSRQHQRCSQNRQGERVRKCFGKVQEGWLGKTSHRGWLQPAVTEAQLPSLCLRRLCSGSPRAPRPAGRSRSCRSRALPALTPCCNPSRA